jgi:hypothetical protein
MTGAVDHSEKADAAKRGSVLAHQEKRASRAGISGVEAFECNLPQGCGNGTKNASFEIRKGSQSHAFD